ncbi:MAG TPA: O-antigen ligase family protein [Gemmataceae bacterium]|nr:O-antigen ligase family protein [Gemmataceae bacterium]
MKVFLYLTLFGGLGVASLNAPLVGAINCMLAYFLNPVIFGPEVRYQLLTTSAFLAACLIHRPCGVDAVGREGVLLRLLWAFLAVGALSACWAVVSSEVAMVRIWEVAKTVLLASLLPRVLRNERHLSLLMVACVIGVWHAAFMHTFGISWGYVPGSLGREIGVLPDAQSSVMILFVPTLFLFVIFGSTFERVLCCCALPFVLNSIVVSYQRTYFLALIGQAIALLFLLPRRVSIRILPVFLVVALLYIVRLAPPDYWQWIATIKDPEAEASANCRLVTNEASWQMFQDYPLGGVGYRNYPDVSPQYLDASYLTEGRRSAHNSYLTILCETGLAGFIPWMCAFAGTIWCLRRIRRQATSTTVTRVEWLAMGIEVGLYGWFVGGLTMADHEIDPAYWFVALAVVLVRLHAKQRQALAQPNHQDADCTGEENGWSSEYPAVSCEALSQGQLLEQDSAGVQPSRALEAAGPRAHTHPSAFRDEAGKPLAAWRTTHG